MASRAISAQKKRGELVVQGPLRLVVDLHEMEQARLEEWLESQTAWGEIRSLGTKARRDKIRLTRSLHTLGFLHALFEEGAAAASPAESEEIFYLALLLAGQLPAGKVSIEHKNDLCAECCAEIATARDALKKGLEYAGKGSQSGVAEGKVLWIEGSLEDDLGNIEEAAKSLRRAVELFEAAAEPFFTSRALVLLAYVQIDVNPAESLRVIEQALSRIPDNNPRLVVFAEGIKIDCLMGLGAPQEALLRFKALKGLHEQFREPFIQLRRRFTAARILEHLGRQKKADSLFQEVIAADLEHGLVKNFFLDLVYWRTPANETPTFRREPG
jgi:tetratricopeptide (TPR) repeat protein